MRRGENTEVGRVSTMGVARGRGRGRPAKQLKDVVEHDMRVMGLEKGMAMDRKTWIRQIYGPVNLR